MPIPVDELPPLQGGRAAWLGPDIARSTTWLALLERADLDELRRAAEASLARNDDIAAIRRETFPLPGLAPRLEAWHDALLHGEGFVQLRGLPVADWPLAVSAAAFFGLGTHLGNPRPQNARGHVLGHVIDLGLDGSDPSVRLYQTHERQTFHTDSCDVVGLLCLRQARRGGESALVSSLSMYNEMKAHAPQLAAALFDALGTDRRGEVPPGARPFFEIPVFNWHSGLLSTIYQRQYLDSAQRFPEALRLTDLHVEALDRFDALANDPRLNLHLTLEPGDVQFVHNHVLLHDRTAFEDWPEPSRRRHLLRLWLAPERARPLPPAFAQRFGSVVPGDRGGVGLPASAHRAPLTPE